MAPSDYVILLLILATAFGADVPNDNLQCAYDMPNIQTNWIVVAPECLAAVTDLINLKLGNAAQFLALGAYFSRDSVNRLGFSKLFYDSADSDRDDAIGLIDYILTRGEYTDPNNILQLSYVPPLTEWESVQEAVVDALALEAVTTSKFHDAITTCETQGVNDYNIANWMSKYFLMNQYKDQKYFADLVSSLKKMEKMHQNLGEFLTDREFH